MSEKVRLDEKLAIDDLTLSRALDTITSFTEGGINPSNISESKDLLLSLLNIKLSDQLKLSIIIIFMAFFGLTTDELKAQAAVPENVTPVTDVIETKTTGWGLRVRSQPNGDILDSLSQGQAVRVLGYDTATGLWAYIDYQGDEAGDGFAAASFLELSVKKEIPVVSNASVILDGKFCGSNGSTANDSGNNLCQFRYNGTTIFYAHNYTVFGETILNMSKNIGEIVPVYVDGNLLGEYEVISAHEATGTSISRIISNDALNSTNNEIVTFVTTNRAKEAIDPTARIVVTLRLV